MDLREFSACARVAKGADHVFNLAADMGGMGFIQSNHSVIFYNNTMISFNMLEAARQVGIQRYFYASSACIYPENRQLETEIEGGGLKEDTAWPAQVGLGGGLAVRSGGLARPGRGVECAGPQFSLQPQQRPHSVIGCWGPGPAARMPAVPAAGCCPCCTPPAPLPLLIPRLATNTPATRRVWPGEAGI